MFQIPLGIIGQLYTVCAVIGCGFVFGSAALGMLDQGEDGGVDVDVDGDSRVGIDTDGDGIVDSFGDDMGTAPSNAVRAVSMSRMLRVKSGCGNFFLALLSPMAVAMFLGFFGLGGLITAFTMPWLGLFTLIPAFGSAFIFTSILKLCLRWMFKSMHSNSSASNQDIIGQTGEVNIPIPKSRTGEVVYVVHSKRYHSSARALNENIELKKGEKVVIVDIKDHLIFVEPCDI